MNETLLESLQNLQTIRRQTARMLALARQSKLRYFFIAEEQMPATVNYVIDVILSQYPSLIIPYHSRWRHFEKGAKDLFAQIKNRSQEERGQILYELVILSVLLDAGAGMLWHYREPKSGQIYTRSEGLALASLDLYLSGTFSVDKNNPLRVDAEPLLRFNEAGLNKAFQVTSANPLLGVAGRHTLLNRLGSVIEKQPDWAGRLGYFYSYLSHFQQNNSIKASKIFQETLSIFRDIWPNRLQYQGITLGDVWVHPALKLEAEPGSELIPFHKLTQWLTYSLIEPLEQMGIEVTDLDALTGLAEYRNGGLFIDMGVIVAKNPEIYQSCHPPDSELIVEWRALTVALLDELAEAIRQRLKMTASALPLAKILQGGTWEAGRRIAKERRCDASPPLKIISDGTIF